ncbi:hypothetical protein BDV97DRAFT_49577 [Delphinella strobiligena]|nr:hypothetical protein BDV97DRAFT_49577 [Delphinella strobiligena]
MGRIKKTATERHEASVSPYISGFIKQTIEVPLHKLPKHIATFPVNWPFPRGDLYHWIPTLNRFDRILELFVKEYALDEGPQTQPFELRLLAKGDGEEGSNANVGKEELLASGYSEEGDRELCESVLHFTRVLLERCGNRSLYASSSHLNHLLNTLSLSLLKATLRVTLRLAQRYHTSRLRMATPHTLSALLAGHYNINLDKILKLASPFPKKAAIVTAAGQTPFKAKAKVTDDIESTVNTADIAAIVKCINVPAQFQEELSGVQLTYYEHTAPSSTDAKPANAIASPMAMAPPATPTPVRRRSNLIPGSASRSTGNEEPADTPAKSVETPDRPILSEGAAPAGPKVFELQPSEIANEPAWKVVKEHVAHLPKDYQFDLLHRIRVASAFNTSKPAVNDLVAVRLLAIANLAYVYSESQFAQKIAQPDSEEPRQTQLAQQLTELLQPSSEGQQEISKDMIVTVIMALEALTKTKSKSSEVTQALNISVSHGVLFYVLRKVQATLAEDDLPFEEYDWCKDMLDLVQSLAQPSSHQQRNADAMVSAGFIGILVDILTLRTKPAQVYFPAALHLIDTFIHNGVRDAFTALVNTKGLDVLADLTSQEVQLSVEAVQRGESFPAEYRAQTTNYQIPFIDQLILRQLLKFIAHMYAHSVGTNDRLLRNLVDSPQLLGALKTVVSNADLFGSNVWSGAINILSSFIHNEPTSYQVIAEAGLSKMFLEAITRKPITVTDISTEPASRAVETSQNMDNTASDSTATIETTRSQEQAGDELPAAGILPVGETMRDIPPVFGAICLNENGFRMFQASDALEKFLEIFQSPNHVKAMEEENEVAGYIGQSFNELVRHHDQLRERIATATLNMVKKVVQLCEERAKYKGVGAKLWVESSGTDGPVVAGGRKTLEGIHLQELEQFAQKDEHNYHSSIERNVDAWLPNADGPNPSATESQLESDDLTNGVTGGRSTSDFISVVCRFLQGYLSHSKTYTPFIEQGGAELLLDLAMAPCNPYNFHELSTSEELSRVIQMLVTEKPHLILPSLVKRTQLALRQLKPLVEFPRGRERAFFKGFTIPSSSNKPDGNEETIEQNGTYTLKAMVSTQTLVGILSDVLSTQNFYENRHRSHNLLAQVNLTDLYADLVDSLAKLNSACVWEEIMMQNVMPDDWREETRVKGMGYDNTEANKVMGMDTNRDASGHAQPHSSQSHGESSDSVNKDNESTKEKMRQMAAFKNTQVLTYLLSQIPIGISSLFQALGKSLLTRTRNAAHTEWWQRQNANTIAEHLAVACVDQLSDANRVNLPEPDTLAYEIVILTSVFQMVADKRQSRNGTQSAEILTLILRKFVEKGGLSLLEQRLLKYRDLIREHQDVSKDKSSDDSDRVYAFALAATNIVLDFYSKITHPKNICDAAQTTTLTEPHRDRAEFFVGSHLLVELRLAILPTVIEIWNSLVMLMLPTPTVKDIIDLLRLNLEGENESQALRRPENIKKRVYAEKRKFKVRREHLDTLVNAGVDQNLAVEALYRCNNAASLAREYANFRQTLQKQGNGLVFTFPPQEKDLDEQSRRVEQPLPSTSTTPQPRSDQPTTLARIPSVEMRDGDDGDAGNQEDTSDNDMLGQGNQRDLPRDILDAGIAQVLSHALAGGEDLLRTLPINARRTADDSPRPAEIETEEKYITVEDLDEKREELRDGLIDRCLDILNTHIDVTFELSDLITAAVAKAQDDQSSKSEIGQTLVNSLMSLRPEDGVEPEGKKISSYAHLLALVLSQREFFQATLDALKENFEFLGGFIKINPGQKPDEASPWIGSILAVIELVLAEDEQPQQIQWTTPDYTVAYQEQPIAGLKEPIVPFEEKSGLFDALVELLPKIGKDTALAVAVVRVLIYLTRHRPLAQKLSEKKSMTRLFSMMKQLAALAHERLQVDFMVLLRHIIEDDDTIRQVMRTEIQAVFENNRSQRPLDTTAYVRNLSHIALRNTELFVEVTNERVQIIKWEPNRGPQHLMLKRVEQKEDDERPKTDEQAGQSKPEGSSTAAPERPTIERTKTFELKPPVVDNPDGVIQFLLSELSKYKDVEDKEDKPEEQAAAPTPTEAPAVDVDMTDSTPTPSSEASPSTQPAQQQQPPKQSDKDKHINLEQHPIYVYRCFIMACLTELLASYNRTKVEFINFSRKAEYQTSTPSKPRSGLLNYLLYNLVPTSGLSHASDIPTHKRDTTSFWAISVLVSLTAKTNEKVISFHASATGDEEPDLIYVRKFVLEHALRAFKDATVSVEPLDQKYARLLSLSELFNRMLTGKPVGGTNAFYMDMLLASQKHLGRLMYEKNFISALTASIAEIDLNFPGAKRALKYILRPMKWLTDVGVTLSTSSDYSSSNPTTTEEDEISSATSVSDDDQEREETPDLFRNSTLAMFEPENEDDDEDDDDDDEEEDYYEGYDEEMDYDEDQGPDVHEGDVVSDDDDDDIDGMGDIEGLPGDVPMELEIAMDGEEDDSEDEDDGDSDMDEDDDDDDGHDDSEIEIIDELTGDDENGSMIEDDQDEDEEGWEDDAGDEYDEHDHLEVGGSPHGGPLEHMVRVLDGDDRSDVMDHFESDDPAAHLMDLGGEQYFEDEMADEDGESEMDRELLATLNGDADDQDEEDFDEEDVIYEPEIEDDDPDTEGMGWGWDDPSLPPGATWRRDHHAGRGNPFTVAIGEDIFQPTRSHGRTGPTGPTGRGNEDGTNPLLQRAGRAGAQSRSRQDPMGEWMYDGPPTGLGRLGQGGPFGGRDGLSFVSDLIQMVGPRGGRINIVDGSGGAFNFAGGMAPVFHIAGGPGGNALRFPGNLRPPSLSRFASFFGGRGGAGRLEPSGQSRSNNDPSGTIAFTPTMTHERWKDETKVIYGVGFVDKALKIVNSILRNLVPQAQEAKRQRDKAETERRLAEEKAREEARQKEEAERAEREGRERKEREEREAREREEAEAAARERAEKGEPEPASENMEGVEGQSSGEPAAPAQPRVTTEIRGREIDITHLGIDLEYLEALPEDMREEVIMQQFAEQRSQEAQSGELPSEISREFLDALPPEIQQELIRSEAADRRRRERDEARRRAAASGNGPAAAGPGEMDNADFFATLPPALRQNILMEADDDMLQQIPEEFAPEARAILGDRRQRREAHESRRPNERQNLDEQPIAPQEHRARRPVAQMLDKSGVATLLRLMFIALQGSARSSMHGVLSDICKNTQNRAEVISVLLQILQDGSADANALEKSFAQLNFRAKQISSSDKTPKPLKRSLTGQPITPPNTDISPLMIVQQCLSTLTVLSHENPRVSSFFLSEHETSISQRLKQSKKGKAKESKASKYPVNALLTLLDRKTIIENSAVMEHLAALLIKVTEPLKILLKRAKEAEKEKDKPEEKGTETSRVEGADVAMTEGEAASAQDAAENKQGTSTDSEKKAEEKKKHRELTPPEVPEENLRLVVNIIAARECNSKTFQSTLEIINHLSAIPGAKDTFGRELVHRAQQLGESVLEDLKQLLPQIESAKTGTDVQGAALANFSPASSHQTKLLRVLLALDYLFDPKHAGTLDRPMSAGEALAPKSREDLLSTLYETSTFVSLWTNLSNCLTAIRQRGNMSNVATILQPLIESFMVVCKNTTTKENLGSKESPLAASQELFMGTPPADSRIESLFFSFTEDHRKILNDLVRNNPKLLNGTFDVLAKNSKVLEFDNKRNYFNRRLHDRRAEERAPHSTIQLNIRRDQIFMDSFKNLYYKSANEIKHGKLNIRFHGEEGVDAGGVTREWFGALSRQMFNPDYALFNPVASDRTTFHPNPMSGINPEHLLFFKFIGRIIGKALYEGRVLDCHFSRAVYKRILGKAVNLKDMETLDLDYYKSLCWILENDITDVTFETFSLEVDKFGETETIDLIPDGRNIPVTEENKQEYVKLVVEQRLTKSVDEQLENFLQGFHEIIPAELVSIFSEQELELLISGLPDIDVDDWKNNTEYHNYQPTSPQIQWFWRAVRSFDKEEKAKLLQFVTGTSKVPLNGFKELEGMNGFSRFNIHRDFGNKERLPSSHTCFNQMDLPEYESYEQLRQAMYTAMTQGSEYFGFA